MKSKKIRGFKRHLQASRRRAQVPAVLDAARLAAVHYDYHRLGIAPWRRHDKPPRGIRRLWVAALLAGFCRWQHELAALAKSYYLAIWLFEPAFGDSQLVAAVNERIDWYEQLFGEPTAHPLLPHEYHALPGADAVRWTTHARLESFSLEEFYETARLARKPHWFRTTPAGEPYVLVQLGWVWVGRAT